MYAYMYIRICDLKRELVCTYVYLYLQYVIGMLGINMSITFSGNLGRVDYISEFEYDLFIRPDTCNPRYCKFNCARMHVHAQWLCIL